MGILSLSPAGSSSSDNDSSQKEKTTTNVLQPIVSNQNGILEDPSVAMESEDTHMGEFGTKRDLSARHVSMIAIAGTLGTGLFLGSGAALSNGGPVGFFLGYLLVGCLVGLMMYCLGEM